MEPVKAISELATDYAKLATFVYALVEIYKDLVPTSSPGLQRLAAYLGGIVVSGLVTWHPGMPWQEYIGLAIFNGVAIGMMSIGLHQTVQRSGQALMRRKEPPAA